MHRRATSWRANANVRGEASVSFPGWFRVGADHYDRPVDPYTARQLLRIFPDAPLTVDLVDRAYSGESWARHPSRYPDPVQRQQAEAWAASLEIARDVLLREVGRPAWLGAPVEPHAPAAPSPFTAPSFTVPGSAAPPMPTPSVAAPGGPTFAPARRRGLRWPAVAGIVAGSLAVLALIVVAAVGATRALSTAVTDAQRDVENTMVDRYQSGETLFEFPAALEYYYDGRYDELCIDAENGCWEAALFTESDCAALQIVVAYSDDPDAWQGEHEVTLDVENVVAYEATPFVFGDDAYDYGWVQQVTCLDAPTV